MPQPKTVADWKKLVVMRRDLDARARHAFAEKQEAYEAAAGKKLSTRQAARMGAEKTMARLYNRHRLLISAEKGLKTAHKVSARAAVAPPSLQPERTVLTPNFSSRGGMKPRLIVLHITVSHNTEGLADIDSILSWFAQQKAQASSHIVNDAEGNDARCVLDANKAWTCAAFNSVSLNIEQIEFSSTRTREQWMSENKRQLDNTAAWVAKWSVAYDIPLVHSTTKGVCQHMELGAAGGGHSDCGNAYPLDYVLAQAKKFAPLYEKLA